MLISMLFSAVVCCLLLRPEPVDLPVVGPQPVDLLDPHNGRGPDLLRVQGQLQPDAASALWPRLLPCLHPWILEPMAALRLPTVPGGSGSGAVWLLPPRRRRNGGHEDLPEVRGVVVRPTPAAPPGQTGLQLPPASGASGWPVPEEVSRTLRGVPLLLRWRTGIRVRRLSAGRKPCSTQGEGAEAGGGGPEGKLQLWTTGKPQQEAGTFINRKFYYWEFY